MGSSELAEIVYFSKCYSITSTSCCVDVSYDAVDGLWVLYHATGPGSQQPPRFGTFMESFNQRSSSILWITDMWRRVFVFGTAYAVYVPPYDVTSGPSTSNFTLLPLFIITMPQVSHGASNTFGYKKLVDWIPTRYRYYYVKDLVWIYITAMHLVWTIDNAPFLQTLFTNPFSQYCGKIGFALYLVHGTVLWTMGLNK